MWGEAMVFLHDQTFSQPFTNFQALVKSQQFFSQFILILFFSHHFRFLRCVTGHPGSCIHPGTEKVVR